MRPILILLLVLLSLATVQAQDYTLSSDDEPYPCPFTSGTFYQAGVFPRYDVNSDSLILVDANGTYVRTLEPLNGLNVRVINWSPDCRYLSGALGAIRAFYPDEESSLDEDYVSWEAGLRQIVLWDTINGERLQTFFSPNRFLNRPTVTWNSDGSRALILGGTYDGERTRCDFIWQRETNTKVRVGGFPLGDCRYWSRGVFHQIYWDSARGWLWGSALGGVVAYDVNTGLETAFFTNSGIGWLEARFVFSADSSRVVTYSISETGGAGEGGIMVYDIATMTSVLVNVEGFAAPAIPPNSDNHPVTLSADNRYLVIGYDVLRVWDIQNLPENIDERLPIYRHSGPDALIWNVRFSDWGVIETTSEEGVQHWNLHTGEFIP